jgi:hypothetical protein
MRSITELDKHVKGLKEARRERFAIDLKLAKEELDRQREKSKYDEELAKDILRASGIDTDRIEEIEREESERYSEYLKELRPKLIERPSERPELLHNQAVMTTFSSYTDSIILPPFTAEVLVSDRTYLDGIDGKEEEKDISITPDNPGDINLKVTHEGDGTFGTIIGGMIVPYVDYDLWYTFVPPSTGTYQIKSSLDFHGFYILKSNDKWWNSKSAFVRLSVNLDVNQQFWQGKMEHKVIDIEKSNVDKYQIFDETRQFITYAELVGGDSTVVLVNIELVAGADGNGSYAEINFADGNGNYIQPNLLTAVHL